MPPPEPYRSPSPDPIDLIGDHEPRTPRRNENVNVADTSPAVRKPHWGRVPRFPSETPSEDANRSSTAQSELSPPSLSASPEVDGSPAVRRPWGRRIDGQSKLKQPSVADADSDDDLDDTLSYASQIEAAPRVADGTVFTYLESSSDSDESSSMELEASLPTMKPVSHLDGIGAVVVPFRPEPEFPQPLRDAEEKLASQIAAALTSPGDEALNSETFQTLLETFLFPRLAGCNSKDQRFKLRQYSQLHAVACTFKQPPIPTSSGPGKRKRQDYSPTDSDPVTRERLKAVKERRVPDMTSVAIFEEKVPIPNSRAYQMKARKGPKICITEIKSFDWNDDEEQLEYALRGVLSKAHYQNYVAAQYLFREDEHLLHVASFTGTGFVWSFSEFHRWQYPLLYDRPLPVTEGGVQAWEESVAVTSPRNRKKAKRSSSMQDSNAREEEGEDDEEEEGSYPRSLDDVPNMPPANTPLDEIFRRYEQPEDDDGKRRKRVSFLPILDLDGRTYEAFDVIVERMRRWYLPSKKNTDPDHQLVFDADPYEHGTCPATVARKEREQQVEN